MRRIFPAEQERLRAQWKRVCEELRERQTYWRSKEGFMDIFKRVAQSYHTAQQWGLAHESLEFFMLEADAEQWEEWL